MQRRMNQAGVTFQVRPPGLAHGAPAHTTGVKRRQIRAPSVRLPEIVIPSASVTASLQSPTGTLLVLWPESFRGGCSFGTGSNRFLPTRSSPDNGEGRILARANVAMEHIFVAMASSPLSCGPAANRPLHLPSVVANEETTKRR
ncbi:hypothetical protein AOX55_00001798 [Sinorhizobium fredii CCBAU 25509]|nr:hypothetical protein SF83666_c15590 [Sinorhizobium fredii CCBAU 83666]AWM25052.1 hypothetical protein AOX55_00001798 [Sinorhizobium fredii CCBAU 25509]